jgi:hypothetical protein
MATRVALPNIPRIAAEFDHSLRELAGSGQRGLSRRLPRGAALHRILWRTVTAPYWLASDVPAPQLPRREAKAPAAGLAGNHVARLVNEIGRRIWIQRALTIVARSLWLGILAGTIWLFVDILGGPDLDVTRLVWIGAILAVPGLIFATMVRPTRRQVARMLDRSFGLQERMTTAVENLGKSVPQEGERASMTYLQIADAANVVTELRRHSAFAIRPPVRELVMAIICALIFACLYFARGVGAELPGLQAGAVPPFTPASERMAQQPQTSAPTGATANAPSVAQVQDRADRSNQARQDLDTLAKALDDHAVTSSAADAMAQGDYPTAANELRELADEASDLSPSSREALANDLDNAASQMSPGSQDLADATQQAADGLREGDQAAQNGVRNLGDAVEETGNEVVSQEELAQQMQQAEAAQAADQNSGQAGSQSQSSSSDQSRQSGEQSSSEATSGEQADGANEGGESGETSPNDDANQGADAQSDQNSGNAESGQNSGNSPQGAQSDGQTPGGEGSQASEPTDGQQQGQPGANGQQSSQGQPGESGAPNGEQSGDNPGDGAGSGASPEDDPTNAGQAQPGSQSETAGGETPADPNVANGNGEGGQGQETGEGTDPREAISLSRAPEGESYQTSPDGGGSNVGSGPGVSVSSGTSTQGEVGTAGPDSNRVPPSYRSAVEDYFSESGGS